MSSIIVIKTNLPNEIVDQKQAKALLNELYSNDEEEYIKTGFKELQLRFGTHVADTFVRLRNDINETGLDMYWYLNTLNHTCIESCIESWRESIDGLPYHAAKDVIKELFTKKKST